MHQTCSATPLAPILVEPNGFGGADVWMRDNILEVAEEVEGGIQVFYVADEVHALVAEPPTIDEIEDNFDEWWERIEEASLTDAEKLEKLEAQVLFTALMTDTEV